MTDYEEQRVGMVESQVRPNEVTDPRLLTVMRGLPRERFLPEELRGLAYMDEDIEILPASEESAARFLLSPMVQAQLIQLAEITAQNVVLDVGCATGYSTAVLAQLAARVVGVEPEPELVGIGRTNLKALGLENVDIAERAFDDPPKDDGPYDAILLEGSLCQVPEALLDQLKEGGRLIAVLTEAPNMRQGRAYLFVRVGGEARGVPLFDAGAAPLPGIAHEAAFAF